ncbi:hypothetical protein NERG_02307 [Nematocida ausubeli]|uniref:Uncharacterized protein n=1 Tax=Nematocida ausubeli (strain ATCC PRA-371 / ERTm2) TaxID=1913371 RepID=H8ZFD6_NEMA1|nr:hypothetical protein NERG_02307 [Nematocida ausubeli]
MKPKGLLAVFQKHLQREVFSTPEYKVIQECIDQFQNTVAHRYILAPILSQVTQLTLQTAKTTARIATVADILAEAIGTSMVDAIDKTISIPLDIMEYAIHTPIVCAGRVLGYPGVPYKRHIDIRKNNQALNSLPETKKQVKDLIVAVLEGIKYDDILQEYSPYAWRNIRVAYTPGELLDVTRIEYSPNKKEVQFNADMYNEAEDKIVRKKSKWSIKESAPEGVTVHKVEVADIL